MAGKVRRQLTQANAQNSTIRTRPARSLGRSGFELIHSSPVMRGALRPTAFSSPEAAPNSRTSRIRAHPRETLRTTACVMRITITLDRPRAIEFPRPRVSPTSGRPGARPFTTGAPLMSTYLRRFARSIGVAGALAVLLAPATGHAAGKKAAATPARSTGAPAGIKVEEHVLSNGMKLLLIPRHLSPTVAGGWVAHVGAVNERPGITGISHLFEHMMFKGSHAIGTRDYAKDVALIDEQERTQDQMRDELSKMRAAQR